MVIGTLWELGSPASRRANAEHAGRGAEHAGTWGHAGHRVRVGAKARGGGGGTCGDMRRARRSNAECKRGRRGVSTARLPDSAAHMSPETCFYVFLLVVLYLKLRRSNARRAELGLRESRLNDLSRPVEIEREMGSKRNTKDKNT